LRVPGGVGSEPSTKGVHRELEKWEAESNKAGHRTPDRTPKHLIGLDRMKPGCAHGQEYPVLDKGQEHLATLHPC
jgi:hypothetical protein